jgi:RimJ/RimL family protein N-acetyltransferase
MRFVVMDRNGQPGEKLQLPDIAKQMATGNAENYRRTGFEKPWCGYFAVLENKVVGCCAFKAPVRDGRVEIAYGTLPEFEGRGIATQMAVRLIQIARKTDETVLVTAQTLPQSSASTKVLTKLGFKKMRTVSHPEDGEVWEWELGWDRV